MRKWCRFLLGIVLLSTLFTVAPFLYKFMPATDKMNETIEAKNIDASALFYSEESHTLEAGKAIQKKLKSGKP